jgi:Protein of unknown function (DUF3800)
MATLHVHLDESGNFAFSPKGSRFYIFTAVWTYDPAPLAARLSNLRFQLIKEGHGEKLSCFHACDDPQPRRNMVVPLISSHFEWNFAAIVIEKNRVNPSLYAPEDFYPKFLTMVINFVLRGRVRPGTQAVLIYTDTLPFPKGQIKAVEACIKKSCRAELPNTPFHVLHHRIESNYWIQIADYCSWSICRKWEFADRAVYDQLRGRIAATEIAPMSNGDGTRYY